MLRRIWAAIESNKAWKLYRHGAAFRTLLISLGIWPYLVSAGTFAVGIVVASLTALPIWGKILVGLGVSALLLFIAGLGIAAWRIYRHPIEPPNAESRDAAKVRPKRPTVILQSIAGRLSTFELTACDFDAFEIEIRPLACGDAVIGWNLPKTVLLSGETMPATICEIGKSGAYYSHRSPMLLELALDKLTSPDNPVVERSILITYKDAERQQWQTESPVRYDRRAGKTEFLVPIFSPRSPLPVKLNSKTYSTTDQDTLEAFRVLLPNSVIDRLRFRYQIFKWDTSADAALANFMRRNVGADNAFLDDGLEGLRVKLHEYVRVLLDKAYRYTDEAIEGQSRRFTFTNNDVDTYDKNRTEVIELTQEIVKTYDALILSARKQFAGAVSMAGGGKA